MSETIFVPGQIVRIKVYEDSSPSFWDNAGEMDALMGKIVTIKCPAKAKKWERCYKMEGCKGNGKSGWFWRDIDLQKVNTPT